MRCKMQEPSETDIQMAGDIMSELRNASSDNYTPSIAHTDDSLIRDIADSILHFFENLVRNEKCATNEALLEGAAFLAGLTNDMTGNSLPEVYIRVRRLLFHHCRDIREVFPTWLKPTGLNEITRLDDGALTFAEDLIYGLRYPVKKAHVSFPWHEFIIAMWMYGSVPILSISDYRKMDDSSIQPKLDQLLVLSSISSNEKVTVQPVLSSVSAASLFGS